ncbi:MAG: nucleotidyltransferase domain-containing protein [Ruminococcus sp.]|jgi:predicted nucleotidyltransferase|nr:nucleotidyltransferase domain-containing protein [Ruminococcus sp.]
MFSKNEVRQIVSDYAGAVKDVFPVDKVVLFGSYVNGTPNEWSDIDVAVIINNFTGDWYGDAVQLVRLRRNISTDIEPHLLDEINDGTGFCEHVLKTGEIIYEKPSEF